MAGAPLLLSGSNWTDLTVINASISSGPKTDLTSNDSFLDPECIIRSTEDAPSEFFPFLMYGILLNTVGFFGLAGNIISITILSRPNMRSSINCCLIGLATFDSILLTSSLLMFGLPAIAEYTGTLIWYQRDVFPWVTLVAFPLGNTAQTGSIYLTFTVTVERYVAVCHPLKARSLCTYGRARLYVLAVALFAVLYNAPRFLEVTYKECQVEGYEYTTVAMTEMRKDDTYITVYIMWLYMFVMYLIPFISLLVFNAFIYKQVRRMGNLFSKDDSFRRDSVRIANNERQRLTRLQRKELSLAVMLLVVVIVFFICNILAFIVNVLEIIEQTVPQVTVISNFLVTVNSSVNFIIYCIFGQKFRKVFLRMFCGSWYMESFSARDAQIDSGVGGNSVYGDPRLLQANCRVTQSMRMSSWNGSQGLRVSHPQNGAHSWQNRNKASDSGHYVTIPLLDKRTHDGQIA